MNLAKSYKSLKVVEIHDLPYISGWVKSVNFISSYLLLPEINIGKQKLVTDISN